MTVTIVRVNGRAVRLGFGGPAEFEIVRSELLTSEAK
jgi:sRNA-binding carbon storage regulator CsrA